MQTKTKQAKEDIKELGKKLNSISTLEKIVKHPAFDMVVLTIIVINAVVLGLLASQKSLMFLGSFLGQEGELKLYAWLVTIDYFCLYFFVAELLLKLIVFDYKFFSDGWNSFDFVIVALSFVPEIGPLVILRTFRVFRILRLLSRVSSLRRITSVLLGSIPTVLSTFFLLAIVIYVFGVMGVMLFGDVSPNFESLGGALLALFQVMTLDNWSNDIAEPILIYHPFAWLYFVSFILLSVFTVLNLVASVVVGAVNSSKIASHIEQDLKIDESSRKELNERLERIEKAILDK